MSSLYPIGSIYFGTQDTCPLEIILSNSTWTKVASNIVIDVNTSASVAGNGLALGLQGPVNVSANPDGKYGIIQGTNDVLYAEKTAYGRNASEVLSSSAGTGVSRGIYGVTTDSTKSGLKATITRTNLTVNIWERTA